MLGYDRVDIFRPGLLMGARAETRLAERLGQIVSPLINRLLVGSLDRYQSIAAERVAAAMASLAASDGNGRHVHHNREIRRLI